MGRAAEASQQPALHKAEHSIAADHHVVDYANFDQPQRGPDVLCYQLVGTRWFADAARVVVADDEPGQGTPGCSRRVCSITPTTSR